MGFDSDIYGLEPSRLTIPLGATLATFVDVRQGQGAVTFKYFTGGTLEILTASISGSPSTTLSPSILASLSGTGYLMGTNEALNISGPARFYLSATGATCVAMFIKGLTAGY